MRVFVLGILLGISLGTSSLAIGDDAELTEHLGKGAQLTSPSGESPFAFFSEFLVGTSRAHYPTDYIFTAIRELRAVKRKSSDFNSHGAIYYSSSLRNTLYVPALWLDSQDQLKAFSQFSGDEIGSIFHELWHVYFHRRLKQDRSFLANFHYSARKHFPHLSLDKAQEALEEAYGAAITSVVSYFWWLEKHVPARSEHERTDLCHKFKLASLSDKYKEGFTASYNDAWGRTVHASTNVRLEPSEIEWIQSVLFENRLRY